MMMSPRWKPNSPSSCGVKSNSACTRLFPAKAEPIERSRMLCSLETLFARWNVTSSLMLLNLLAQR